MSLMKVGIYDPYSSTLSGGEKYMLEMAKCLSKDNDVSIFWDEEKEIRDTARVKLGIDLKDVKFAQNIFGGKIPFLRRYRQSSKYDCIVYLSDGSIPLVGCKLFLHFQFPVEWVKNYPKTKLKLLKVKKIICNSDFTKAFIDKKFGIKSTVLYPPASSFSSGQKENLILHVGRLSVSNGVNYKKQDVMINEFKQMVDGGLRNWKLVLIIGVKNGDEEELRKLIDLSKGYPIEILDNPNNQNLAKYYSVAKIYWHATGFGEDLEKFPEKAEHFGMSTVEAMSAGAVPVVINAGGQKEIVTQDSGFLWDNLHELKEKTRTLIDDKNLLNKMSEAAIKRAGTFTGERFCQQLRQIIK